MKRQIFLILALFLCVQNGFSINDPEQIFSLDEQKLQKEMVELNLLESSIITQGLMQNSGTALNNPFSTFGQMQESKTILPPFVWGCLGGPLGMLVVYILSDEDSQATMRSFWGCLIGSCIWGSFSGLYYSGY